MTAKDIIRASFKISRELAAGLLADMEDAPLMRTVPGRGNHPYWLLGHIAFSEAALLDQYILGRPNRFEAWAPMFALGSTPSDDLVGGPSYRELLTALDRIRAASLEYVDSIGDDDLARPCREPAGPGPRFDTSADCLVAMTIHMSFHAGQAADARRAAGRKPLFM